jgi:hypothetical protein
MSICKWVVWIATPTLSNLTTTITTTTTTTTTRLKRALEVDAMCRAETPCGFVVARVCKEVNRAIFQALGERRRRGASSGGGGSGGGSDDLGVPDVALVLQLVRSTKALITWQRRYLWPQHHELGTTLIDHHNALEHAIANHAAALYAAFPADFPNFQKASRADFMARKEGEAIRKIYEHQ